MLLLVATALHVPVPRAYLRTRIYRRPYYCTNPSSKLLEYITTTLMTMTTAAANTDAVPTAEAPPGPLYIDTQHDDMVHDAQLDYYGCKLATSSSGECLLHVVDMAIMNRE